MAEDQAGPVGPDLAHEISLSELPDGGKLVGHVGDEPVLLARRGADVFAIGAHCTHYSGPLADGLIVDATVRCPWHHACFDLRTGEALHAPALSPVDSWAVEQRGGKIFVREKRAQTRAQRRAKPGAPDKVVIIGGGGAGFAAAEMLRRRQYQGKIVMLSSDDAPPVDRPNLSKDYLAGNAPEDWVPLRAESFYSDNAIDLRLGATVAGVDVGAREIALDGGDRIPFERLLLATPPTCWCCARFRTAGRSSNAPRRRGGRSCSAPASSGSKSRLPCAPETSKSMSQPRRSVRWSAFWDLKWARSFVLCMRSMASSSIWATLQALWKVER